MRRDLADGRAPVVQLVSTNEAIMERALAKIPPEEWSNLSIDLSGKDYALDYLTGAFPIHAMEAVEDDEGKVIDMRPLIVDGHLLGQHVERVGDDVLQALVEGAGGGGALEDAVEELVEGDEQRVLVRDPQRQHAVQPGVHRREVVRRLQPAVRVQQAEAGLALEGLQIHRRNVAQMQRHVEGLKGAVRPGGFQIVLGPEQAPAGGATLALGQGAQAVQPTRDGRGEPLLAVDVGHHQMVLRRHRLVGAVDAAHALHRNLGLEAAFGDVAAAPGLVAASEIGVAADPRRPGLGIDQGALGAGHEGMDLGLRGGRPAPLDHTPPAAGNHAARAPRDLGDLVRAERGQHRVQHPGYGRQAGQVGDQGLAPPQGLLADDGAMVRDQASETYTTHTGEVWTPWRGSTRRTTATAAHIDARDALRAKRAVAHALVHPGDQVVAFRGSPEANTEIDANRICDALNWARSQWPDMKLATTKCAGAESLALSWAKSHHVDHIGVKFEKARHGTAAPFRANDELIALEPVLVLTLEQSLDARRAADTRAFGPAGDAGTKAERAGIRHQKVLRRAV